MKKLYVLAVLIAMFSFALNAGEVRYNDSWSKQGFSLVQSEKSGVNIMHSVNSFSYVDVDVNGEPMVAVIMPGVFLPNDAGAPNLPGESRFVAIPRGATAKLNIRNMRTETYSNVNIAPAPVIPLDIDNNPLHYEKNMDIFGVNAPYPASPVVLSDPTVIRGVDVVMLAITPFQYNPVTKELTVIRDIDLEIVFEGGNGEFGDPRFRSRWWDPILASDLINYDALPTINYNERHNNSYTEDEEFEYIIITPDDPVFIDWANTIKVFREKQGIYTGVVTITEVGGNSVSAIESYIDNAYNNWSEAPAAVLLLGDYTQITSNMYSHPAGYPAFASDNKYADVNNDDLPDVVLARITGNNATELETMVTKFIDYETNPPTDPDFYYHPITALGWQTERWFQICSEVVGGYFKYQKGMDPVRINAIYSGSPGSTWSTATNTSTVVNYFGPNGLGYIPETPNQLGGWSGGTASMVVTAINNGSWILQHRDHGMYTGWGEPAFTSSNINSLTNVDNKLTYVMSINCQTGAFHRTAESFAEKFHRYKYNGENSGALGLLAATEVSYSFVNDTYVWGVMDNMFPDFMPNETTEFPVNFVMPAFGNAAGKIFLYESSWPYNSSDKTITYRLFHHHGGAFLTLYNQVPTALSVAHQGYISYGSSTFNVSVMPGSLICLYYDGEILTSVTSGGFGQTTLSIPDNLPLGAEVTLTVTKQNFFRHEEQIPVVDMVAAGFVADTTQVCANGTINFTDLSLGSPSSWLWTFEGGVPATSTEQNPQGIMYATNGTYDVTLEVGNGTTTDEMIMEDYVTVMENYEVSAIIAASLEVICNGEEVTFVVEPTNGGETPAYQWKLNGEDVGDGSDTYVTTTLAQGDVVTCELTSSLECTLQNPIMSNDVSVTVNEILPVSVSIATEAEFICDGDEVSFEAIPVNGGTEPVYQWMVNGSPVGENSAVFTTTDLSDGDVVSCELTSNAECISGSPANSNALDMSVNAYPEMLETPQGPEQLDVYEMPTSTYTTAEALNTTEYHWSVSPENAWEELAADMNSLVVTWSEEFKGQVLINVYATNDCGDGPVSSDLEVTIENTFGIGENDLGIGVSVYPNPSNGSFTIKLSSENNASIRMQLRNTVGESIFTEENINVNGEFVKIVDLTKYAEGIYFLLIENNNKVFTQKIVVQK